MIGIGQLEEILSSPEQLDYEAAQRHIERMSKMWKEALAKRRNYNGEKND